MTSTATGPTGTDLVAGLGELHASNSPDDTLACIGIGSCIALFAYDGTARVGGVVHIVLPKHDNSRADSSAKFADNAVPLLIDAVVKKGAMRNRLVFKIAGGSQMAISPGLSDTFKIGERNLSEVKAAIEREGLPLAAADTGGTVGRTARMHLDTGRLIVKTVGGSIREL